MLVLEPPSALTKEMPMADAAAADVAAPAAGAPPSVCLSVVIPAYNERDTIEEVLRRVRAAPIDKEIIVVDDGSTDGTREWLQALEPAADLRVVFQPKNGGKGSALRTGFMLARGN